MTKELRVRAQIVDPDTGRFIKAIDERDLSDFLSLIAPSGDLGKVFIPDLTPVILEVNSHVEKLLELKEKKDLSITHSVVYNLWNKAKISKKESVKEKLNIEVLRESEKALNLIHTRIPNLEKKYLSPDTDTPGWQYENVVDRALDSLLSEVQVFIEIVLCHIHSSAIIDPSLIEEPSVINHCESIYLLLKKWLRNEADISIAHNKITIHDESFVYQCCIQNNIGLNPQALLTYLDLSETPIDIMNHMLSNITNDVEYDYRNNQYSVSKMQWRKADDNKVKRSHKIIRLMQQLVGVLSLFESIEDKDVEYSDSTEIFNAVRELIENKT
ncbi:hypothetical protein [Shewanella sp. 6_MG-2023]|uniref:hypothetical protein n=1 Tax=Shewanella sp. 6_MG-2023 TaxID=3062660 RepID=UPI0026E1294A|nr:hypothetical protein [Shewanella sp. 6_MG-2023]MDO6618538.1 hypothetical protein [Shewanella sp. 6_MG-2023]